MYETVIKELNAFLKGQYMGIHAYEHYIQSVDDFYIKKELQRIQQEHKLHAMQVAERIQNLGGTPVDDEGMIGSFQNYIGKLTAPTELDEQLKTILKGEDVYGIQLSEEIVKGDLDPQSMQLIERILDQDRQHVDTLKKLLQ
ncbi:ferritin-like domain-containing protein [Cytobacillus spongiae]|uniref:ferritin-like domain-containing protein n=1 Tax=Cytobacillus spongiae TaxID=2901381 RepID=UPI001F364E99|nr:ferritin-like domain-containing protein [Cytobacillus spongiae]UII54324.1 ferritin-like domain-containing protein [Cytobacillus spongiae]